jgi:predicted ester cyclase
VQTISAKPALVFRQIIEDGFNHGRLDSLADVVADDLIEHQLGAESGLTGLQSLIRGLREPFPDLHLEIQDAVTSGDMVWARIRARGTNTGSLWGRPATGASMDITVIDIARVVDGKLVEHWGVADRLGMLQQLGVAARNGPSAGSAPREADASGSASQPNAQGR